MQVTTYNQKGEKAGTVDLPKAVFEVAMNPDLVYQVAVTQMGNRRQGTAHSKDRGEVSGGGKKPWRQKGTGRSRQGSIRSPQWRHGGVVFGPRNERVYGGKINKKMKRKALAMILSAKVAGDCLVMIDNLEIGQPKTKEMVEILKNIKKSVLKSERGKFLVALDGHDKNKNMILASRNIPGVKTMDAAQLNVLDLLNSKYLLMPVAAVDRVVTLGEDISGDGERGEVSAKPGAKKQSARNKK